MAFFTRQDLFRLTVQYPWPFMLFWPILCGVLIALGWTITGDVVNDNVADQWIPRRGQYAADVSYGLSVQQNQKDPGLGATTIAAMAIGRDNNNPNLVTPARLEQIRARMEAAESVEIKYQNETYRWEDVCLNAAGYPYRMPCARLSPLDYFQEARWFFDVTNNNNDRDDGDENNNNSKNDQENQLYRTTWYDELLLKQLVAPRLPRFGILMMPQCAETTCRDIIALRLSTNAPFLLLKDAGGLDYSDPCRICIETEYQKLIEQWYDLIPTSLRQMAVALSSSTSLSAENANNNNNTDNNMTMTTTTNIDIDMDEWAGRISSAADAITINDVVEFHYYVTARSVYGTLGAPQLLQLYNGLAEYVQLCQQYGVLVGLTCPPSNLTLDLAIDIMYQHADADFSSVNTAGLALPLWDAPDGTGTLFKGNSPVGGSGLAMSAPMGSLQYYLTLTTNDTNVDPTSTAWIEAVEKNPYYAWFVNGRDAAPPETKCGNGALPGTNLTNEPNVLLLGATPLPDPFATSPTNATVPLRDLAVQIDALTYDLLQNYSARWCDSYTVPNENSTEKRLYNKRHFAKLWYDALIASRSFLDIQKGVDDPYTWTISEGCGYALRGERGSYTGQNETAVLETASYDLYYIDEGAIFGQVDRNLLIGGATPPVREVRPSSNPLRSATVLQTIYPALRPAAIPERVANCHRPGTGPLNITVADAEEILYLWKEAMEAKWSRDWQDESQDIQFVAFADDAGIIGSTGRMLREITLSNTVLTIVSIVAIALFSIVFMFNTDPVESRVVVTLVGVALVVLSYFAAVGLALLIGIKIQITIAWTLPFIILGLGVDDMYIVLHTLREQKGYTEGHYLKAMEEVLVPVTMTSVVNAAMFAILNISDIAAIYETARVALFAVISLYIAIVCCFPAYCYVDMRRQAQNKRDFCLGAKHVADSAEVAKPTDDVIPEKGDDWRSVILYDKCYMRLVLGPGKAYRRSFFVIWAITAALVGAAAYGLTQVKVGLGLEEFFPNDNPAFVWASTRTKELASWNIGMRWGALSYEEPMTQMKMIRQFEQVTESSKVSQTDTDQLWMGSFLIWSSRLCKNNLVLKDFDQRQCGYDKTFTADGSVCAASWTENTLELRNYFVPEPDDPKCYNFAGGICRKGKNMHPADMEELRIDPILNQDQSYCPVIEGWSAEKWQFCLKEWRTITGTDAGFVLQQERGTAKECSGEYETDQDILWPLPISTGPTMYAFDLFAHEDTLDLMDETRTFCDDDEETHCWLTGIPYDYWTQYEYIYQTLLRCGGYSSAVGFLISFCFLCLSALSQGRHSVSKVFLSSLIGSFFIFVTIVLSFIVVVGLSLCAGVSLTGFSNMSFVLSVAYSVEYSVHIVERWMRCDAAILSGIDRVRFTMRFLTLPTFMSFVSSAIGVCCLAFTAFDFNETYFFRPLILVMLVTYFFGCWWLPSLLVFVEADVVRLGSSLSTTDTSPSSSIMNNSNSHADVIPPRPTARSFDSETSI